MPLTKISLFSGIGGIDLAAKWAGFETVAFCEREPYCQRILRKNFGEGIVLYDDIRNIKGSELPPVDLISGGFPCQPFSVAGKQRGRGDDRDLWPEMFRVIRECKPSWVLGENVAGFLNMELERTVVDMESEDYEVGVVLLPASAVNAPHIRQRTWIVAHTRSGGNWFKREREFSQKDGGDERHLHFWKTQPMPGRVADGVPNRVDRLRALGNAVVPQQVFPILNEIARIQNAINSNSHIQL